MWPLKSIIWENQEHCSQGSNTHLWDFSSNRWEIIHLLSKPKHVTHEIDCLGKSSPVLKVSTHIYGVSKERHGKTFIFQVNLGMWPLKLIVLEKQALFWRFSTCIYGISKEVDRKMFIFQVNLGLWPLKLIILEKLPCSDFNIHLWEKEIDGKMFSLS